MKKLLLSIICFLLFAGVYAQRNLPVQLTENASEQKVNVFVNGKLFTSYIHPGTIKKPVLWPVVSPAGNTITRSFPLSKKGGERADHPHHVGIWFNYGDVNGLDFWNNSDAIPAANANKYGTIVHRSVDKIRNGKKDAELTVSADWVDINKNKILDEQLAQTRKNISQG